MAATRAKGQQFASFRDNRVFPAYGRLPEEHDLDPDYFTDDAAYKKHWAFLSEIVEVERLFRLVLNVQDKAGNLVRVAFYTDGRGLEIDSRLTKPGHTVLNLYGVQHDFFNGSVGIREEIINSVKIIPMSLDDLLRLSDRDCQTVGWTENGHKKDCRIIVDKDVQGLLKTDWSHFDDFIQLPLK
ncbi:hypothetical protein CMQ_3032 [Grosmannia clavigera kw1407]|uniref:Uncharacterized protein n=1 Tax=Grosmannia clavigera (strain kw1407 / UAMH 11150) TaxID=655863 RepID=F0XGK9_GROCL|nr:uncharacterized protein CMQ_3032 [Grosmannia clavigera kw1407]EFX03103.1 hypothetical protein CMQ_3032 [Grosmannia clavigera kw1407]